MSHKFNAILIVFALVLAGGCATIVKGTNQKIPIGSSPSNADIYVDGNLMGSTPLDVQISRKRDHLVTIAKPGYHDKSVPVVKNVGGAVWGNILLGGFIGWGVDAISGAQYNLNTKTVNVKLEPLAYINESEPPSKSAEFVEKLNGPDDLVQQEKVTPEEYLKLRTALFKQYFPELLPSDPGPGGGN